MLFQEVTEVFSTKSAVYDVSIIVHRGHVLLNIGRARAYRGDIRFQGDGKRLWIAKSFSLHLLSGLAALLFL